MALIRWTAPARPLHGLTNVHEEMNRFIDGVLQSSPTYRYDSGPRIPVDVEETAEAFVLRADLPGVPQKDIKVSAEGDTLTIRGERKHTAGTGTALRSERKFGAFERTFTLGAPVRTDQVRAVYRDGVLEVTVPKSENARLREIEVQAG